MMGIGVIGAGYWGPNFVRNFHSHRRVRLVCICDKDPARLIWAKQMYPEIRVTQSPEELIADPKVNAVAIMTPAESHFALAKQTITAGKHALVAKPLTTNVQQAEILEKEAEKKGVVLMVDHTFIFSGSVQKIREMIDSGSIGNLRYFDATRINLGLFQQDINVLWDLATHDLAILNFLVGENPTAVSATGYTHIPRQPEYAAFLTLFFPDKIAHINVNWLSPVKVRRLLVGGSKKMIVYDDVDPDEKVKVYEKSITEKLDPENIRNMLISYRTGDIWCPKIENTEALRNEIDHFLDCVEKKHPPISNARQSISILRVLEAANQSIRFRGQPVEVT